jgi:hypothetical protein
MIQILISTNSQVRSALTEARGIWDDGIIADEDLVAVYQILTNRLDFIPDELSGTARNYPTFVLLIQGGILNKSDYVNAYLIRIPQHGWFFLQTRLGAPPMVMRRKGR